MAKVARFSFLLGLNLGFSSSALFVFFIFVFGLFYFSVMVIYCDGKILFRLVGFLKPKLTAHKPQPGIDDQQRLLVEEVTASSD